MIQVSNKATKAEILQALKAANTCLADATKREQALREGGTDWPAVRQFVAARATIAWRELKALVVDTYRAGTVARQWVNVLVDTYRRPLLKSKA
jgi:hypothetical protein